MTLKSFSFILAFILYSTIVLGKIAIRGRIVDYDGTSLVYYNEVKEGIFTPYWKEIKPSANGVFKIEFENAGYGSVRLSYKHMYFRFFHDADSQIYFEIKELPKNRKKRRISGENIFSTYDSLKQISLLGIKGDYEAINRFYNRNLRSSYFTTQMVDGNYYSMLISKESSPGSAMALLDSLKQIEIRQIDRLPVTTGIENQKDEKLDREIKTFLTNEVTAFYGAVFLNAMFLKRKDQVLQLMKDSAVSLEIYNSNWEALIEQMSMEAKTNLPSMTNSPDYIDFKESMAEALTHYKQYDFPQNPSMSLDEMVKNRLFNYDTTLFSDGKSRFAYELSGLQLFLNDQLFYSPALLSMVYDLQAKHPESGYFGFYKEKIEKLKASLEVSKQDFNGAKIIGANYHSFDKLIKRFEGKNILIDIWATWCHPCVEEFKYKSAIQPLIESGGIEILYISIDKPQWEDRWRQSVKINELKGNHFRADKEFIQDMWNAIGDYSGAIPRYVLINKDGKVFKSTAARPSDGSELIKQIELMIAN